MLGHSTLIQFLQYLAIEDDALNIILMVLLIDLAY